MLKKTADRIRCVFLEHWLQRKLDVQKFFVRPRHDGLEAVLHGIVHDVPLEQFTQHFLELESRLPHEKDEVNVTIESLNLETEIMASFHYLIDNVCHQR